jgi:hypothetical protein
MLPHYYNSPFIGHAHLKLPPALALIPINFIITTPFHKLIVIIFTQKLINFLCINHILNFYII